MRDMNSSLVTLIRIISDRLSVLYKDKYLAHQYAWWMLEAITKRTRAELILSAPIVLTAAQEQQLEEWLEKQIKHAMPLAYLIGSVPFATVDIAVEPPILIPRPETEEWVLSLIASLKQLQNEQITILDLATGSGCIALALADALPCATVYGIDISLQALALAQKNAQRNNIAHVFWLASDLFANLPADNQFDLIVSNPPYISIEEWHSLEPSVKEWEDQRALCALHDGLGLIEQIIKEAPRYIKENRKYAEQQIPQLVIEIGYKQGRVAENIMRKYGYGHIYVEKDMTQKDRVIRGNISYDNKKKE